LTRLLGGTEVEMENDQPDAIMARVRKGRWMTMLLNKDGSVRETRWWPTKTAANAWLCMRLHVGAVIWQR
jgi:hypothetical protein